MSQSTKLNVLLILFATISHGFTREAVCSKFHYEEKLLEKMIRQEVKVEAIESDIKKTISTFMENMEQKVDDMNKAIKLNQDNVKQRMDSFADDMTNLADKVDVPRVAFNVYNVKDVNVVTKGKVFIFTTVLLNEGNGYDTNTGMFTSSVAGLYYFTAHVCNTDGKLVYYGITVNGQTVAASVQQDNVNYSCSSVSTVTVLKTGSTVSVQSTFSYTNNVLYQDIFRRISFSGALLHQ